MIINRIAINCKSRCRSCDIQEEWIHFAKPPNTVFCPLGAAVAFFFFFAKTSAAILSKEDSLISVRGEHSSEKLGDLKIFEAEPNFRGFLYSVRFQRFKN